MAKGGFKGKLDVGGDVQRGLIIKVILVLCLAVIAVLLFYLNKDLMKNNKKMIKYIKNEDIFKRDLHRLKKYEGQLAEYITKIDKDASASDLEKIKSGYIDELLDVIKADDLQVDSYRSEIEKSDGFVIFKYNITIVGEFLQLLRFFNHLLERWKHIFVSGYDIRLHVKSKIRIGLTVNVIGRE